MIGANICKQEGEIKLTYIEAKDIIFRYEACAKPVLDGVHFSLNKGEWLCVLGENGSGKSTLIYWLMGFLEKQKGELIVEGQSSQVVSNIGQEQMALVMQNPEDQFIGVTVCDDVAFGLENMAMPSSEMQVRVEEALQLVGMGAYGDIAPRQLSGGQMQRVALAGAVVMEKEILLLDEATSMLDPKGRKAWLDTVEKLCQASACTIISVTHDMEEIMYADKILVLKEGKPFYFGAPKDFFMQVDLVRESGLTCPFDYQVWHLVRKYAGAKSDEIFRRMGWADEI